MSAAFKLIELPFPEFGYRDGPPPQAPVTEFRSRLGLIRDLIERERLTHLVIYGDREHFANLAWLTNFDPRFEEALLIIRRDAKPLMLTGNECESYLPISPLFVEGDLRAERYQPFSLEDQPRDDSRSLAEIFRDEAIDAHSRVGCVGWKSYAAEHMLDLPSYIVDELRFAAGYENVVCATRAYLRHRVIASAWDIAFFEWTNTLASEGMKRVLSALREGARDHDLLEQARYNGVPLSCHMNLKCGNNRISLSSARGERVIRGARFACNIAYWGANCCRAGWAVASAEELPGNAGDYVEAFAGPYFLAMAEWFRRLRTGVTGAELFSAIGSRFGVFLNPGHLIHLDEWPGAPVYPGSTEVLVSGMVIQSDVIPSDPLYYSARMEDSYALADDSLRAELRQLAPDVLTRAEARSDFLRETLGVSVHESVLPLSNLPGIMPAFYLRPNLVFAAAQEA